MTIARASAKGAGRPAAAAELALLLVLLFFWRPIPTLAGRSELRVRGCDYYIPYIIIYYYYVPYYYYYVHYYFIIIMFISLLLCTLLFHCDYYMPYMTYCSATDLCRRKIENQNFHPHPHYGAPCMKYYEGSIRPIYVYRPRKYVILEP